MREREKESLREREIERERERERERETERETERDRQTEGGNDLNWLKAAFNENPVFCLFSFSFLLLDSSTELL